VQITINNQDRSRFEPTSHYIHFTYFCTSGFDVRANTSIYKDIVIA